ncbi:hypothetical protein [Vibrio phage BONAISHI]|nr:hypothetical protein [Vibrio phage BONAISHI]
MRQLRMDKQPKDSSYCMASCVAAIIGQDINITCREIGDKYLEIANYDHHKALMAVTAYAQAKNCELQPTTEILLNKTGYWIISVPSINVPNARHAVVVQVEVHYGHMTMIVHDPQRNTGKFYYGNELQADFDPGMCRRLDLRESSPLLYISHKDFNKGPFNPGK